MLEVLQYVCSDFWRFLQCCIFLLIIAYWKPIEITVMKYSNDGDGNGK